MVGFKEFMRRGLVLFQFIIVLVFQTLVFVYIWYENFARTIPNPFWNYCN
jgi:hypothetical protein